MSDNVIVDQLEVKDVSFPISLHQLITVKGKLIGLQQPQKVKMPDCVLNKVDALLVDQMDQLKLSFGKMISTKWRGDIQIQEFEDKE